MTNKRVLFISTIFPYPKSVGKKVVLGGFFDYFHDALSDGNFKVMSFELPASELAGTNAARYFPGKLSKPSAFRKLFNLLLHSLILRDKSIQESLFWSSRALSEINESILDFNPDIVIFDTIRTGQYITKINRIGFKSILYMDDLFSVRYKNMLDVMSKYPDAKIDAMGNFANNIPGLLFAVYKMSVAIKRHLLKIEKLLTTRSENTLPQYFDRALLISANEVKHLQERSGLRNIASVNPLLASGGAKERTWSGKPEFVFLGSLNLAHNSFSIGNFVKNYMDEMISEMPNMVLRIIGNHADDTLVTICQKYPNNVILDGFVDDLDAVLSGCAAMIAPLVFGSGMKIKMIDALRLGIPVVSTEFGSEGVAVDARGGIIVENDLARYAEICKMLLDADENSRNSAISRSLFEANYSTNCVKIMYQELFFGI